MKYEDLEKVNQKLNSLDVKGKDYVMVNERVKAFRMLYPEGIIDTSMVSNDNGVCVFKAQVGFFQEDGCVQWLATGYAYEKENSTFINKTSYIENCETSAVGRALGFLGIGIDTSVASAEEVQNAIINQDAEKKITKVQAESLVALIQNKMLDVNDTYLDIYKKYGYSKTSDIKQKDYMKIVNEIRGDD